MQKSSIKLIITKTFRDIVDRRQNRWIILGIWLCCLISLGLGLLKFNDTAANITGYRKQVRAQWENRPDKHPHRMAHYGYLVFRLGHPLSIFDNGLDDYLGNVIFLEAHKQNSANLSEAGSSSVLVRFGSFSSAFILQVLVPLFLLFLGFGAIVKEREDATLKILSIQGASRRAIVWGKTFGLWQFSLLLLLPIIPVVMLVSTATAMVPFQDILSRSIFLLPAYALYYFLICVLAVSVSATSKSSSIALVSLIGCWLAMAILVPKLGQFTAQYLFPAPSRIAFETSLEKEILQTGDSHNPDDPHFKELKDSLLRHYQVDDVKKLPINYGGFVMKEGERISAAIYVKRLEQLQQTYAKQQQLTDLTGFINPMAAIKSFSMIASGSDFYSYVQFQNQAEDYRFSLAQKMNELQIQHISNNKPKEGEKGPSVSNRHWREFPDFQYQYSKVSQGIAAQLIPLFALICWLAISVLTLELSSKKLKLN